MAAVAEALSAEVDLFAVLDGVGPCAIAPFANLQCPHADDCALTHRHRRKEEGCVVEVVRRSDGRADSLP